MLAGTNFDDTDERKTSGKNGMGSKATNVFSETFEIEHTSSENSKKLFQRYQDNAKVRSEPKITNYKNKTSYTQLSFKPDYKRFNYPSKDTHCIDEDLIQLVKTYAIEIAMVTKLPVFFNGQKFLIQNLEKYARLYYPDKKIYKSHLFTSSTGDECLLIESTITTCVDVRQISFVNGIRTLQGGVHVEEWRDAIFPPLVKAYNAKKPKGGAKVTKLKTSAKVMYDYLTIFVRCEVDKPKFDTQTKDRLNDPTPTIIKPCLKEIEDILKWGFVTKMEERLRSEHDFSIMKKERGTNKMMITGKKYEPAHAINKEPEKCILYLTEGDGAKTMCLSMLDCFENGRKYNGVFALKGKIINVISNSAELIAKNEEIRSLQQIIGLSPFVDYSKAEIESY